MRSRSGCSRRFAITVVPVAALFLLHGCSRQSSPSVQAFTASGGTSSAPISSLKMSVAASAASSSTSTKLILYDAPVSNNGARCRLILYKKEIPESEVKVTSPADVGGLKSDAYAAINPELKMPAMVGTAPDSDLKLFESDTIARYLISTYADRGPSFQPENPKSNLIARVHDMYMTTIQGCMYKDGPPLFGPFWTRKDALDEYQKQLQVIDDLIVPGTTYLCGEEVSLADATVFPSCVFARHILPKFDVDAPLPGKLERWFCNLKDNDPAFAKVYGEIMGGLNSWDNTNRWDPILGAGWNDDEPPTIFDKIISGEIPSTKVYEDDKVFAFADINPAAPAHILVIPKDRAGLTRLRRATKEHYEILGRLLVAAAEVSKDESLGFTGDGSRIVINDGPDGGQEVPHLHVHVLGGRKMGWPPG